MAELLVIDDQDRTIDLCRRAMPEHQWQGPARSWLEAKERLSARGRKIGLVLLDVRFEIDAKDLLGLEGDDEASVAKAQRRQGFAILEELRRAWPELPVVLMTSEAGTGLERAADRHGALEYTYFLDDEDLDARGLRTTVAAILQASQGADADGPVFWGKSLVMRRIRQRLGVLARGRLPVILGGPTGTGKSLIARHFVHARSARKGRFVSVDLATLPRDLVAAHLFGAVRGAYTGAVADRAGVFEEANGGTVFLDEIGNLGEDVQRMLLSVLQEGVVVRLGDTQERRVDVKLVVATNEDLGAMVRDGRFRSDLYMRLNPASTVVLPSLQERKNDLDRLLKFAVERAVLNPAVAELLAELRQVVGFAGDEVGVALDDDRAPEVKEGRLVVLLPKRSVALLRAHSWPGNLRELMMTVENAITLAAAEAIDAGARAAGRPDVLQLRPKLLRDLLVASTAADQATDGWPIEVRVRAVGGLNKVALDVERQYFTRLYVDERGDFSAMAKVLLGDTEGGRKVQLRFNQLGLKVRDLKERVS